MMNYQNSLSKVVLIVFYLLFAVSFVAAVEKEGSWSKVGREIGEVGHAVGDASKESWDATRAKGSEILEKTGKTSSEVWGKTKEISAEAWDKTKAKGTETMEKTGKASSEVWDKTKKNSAEAWDKTKEGSAELYDKAKGKVHEMSAPSKE